MTLNLFETGTYLRKPGGNVENVDEQKAAGMSWALLNIGGDVGNDPTVWDRQRGLYRKYGVPYGPWMHCRTMAHITFLIGVAENWKDAALIGCNVEDVVEDKLSLQEVGGYLLDYWVQPHQAPVHMATLPWVQNGQGWQHVAFAYLALEMFPLEGGQKYLDAYEGCLQHAFDEGAKRVTLLYSTTSPRSVYPPDVAHCLFTADNVTSWPDWKDTVPQVPPKPKGDQVPPTPTKQWYEKPYLTGSPVGPEKLPRSLYPPSAGKGTFTGDDVSAYKRGISRAGRQTPWSPSTWNPTYGESFAMGDGSGNVGKSGVRGFQRQQFPNDKSMHTGNMGDATYQAMRRALVSDPDSPHYREPIFDYQARVLLKRAANDAFEDAKVIAFRKHLADFCERAENATSSAWTYDMKRPYTGLGVEPEKDHDNDCSSYVILAWWWGRTKSGLAVPDPSGYAWDGYGSTSDDLDANPVVTSGNFQVGDLALYSGIKTGHVVICRRRGDAASSVWSSFGSEPRPRSVSLHYRPDLRFVCRPPLGIEDL